MPKSPGWGRPPGEWSVGHRPQDRTAQEPRGLPAADESSGSLEVGQRPTTDRRRTLKPRGEHRKHRDGILDLEFAPSRRSSHRTASPSRRASHAGSGATARSVFIPAASKSRSALVNSSTATSVLSLRGGHPGPDEVCPYPGGGATLMRSNRRASPSASRRRARASRGFPGPEATAAARALRARTYNQSTSRTSACSRRECRSPDSCWVTSLPGLGAIAAVEGDLDLSDQEPVVLQVKPMPSATLPCAATLPWPGGAPAGPGRADRGSTKNAYERTRTCVAAKRSPRACASSRR